MKAYTEALFAVVIAAIILAGCATVPPRTTCTVDGIYHVVERGQTIWRISKVYGVNPKYLMEINGITDPTQLEVGQLLFIPGATRPLYVPPATTDPVSGINVPNPEDLISPGVEESFRWRYIVIHHSATDEGNAKAFDRYHRQRGMENGLAYHFVIGNGTAGKGDGEIEVGKRWRLQLDGGHTALRWVNHIGIGICLVGNFSKYTPTPRQMEALTQLVAKLMRRYNIPLANVVGHGEIHPNHTECPGKYFPMDELKSRLRSMGFK